MYRALFRLQMHGAGLERVMRYIMVEPDTPDIRPGDTSRAVESVWELLIR